MKSVQPLLAHLGVLLLGVGIFFVQGPSFVHHLGDRVADPGDSLLNAWILAWNAHALADPDANVWDAPFYYPIKNTFTFSETMFGNLWITLPVQYLTGNPTLAFNALVLSSFVLGMYCTFLLVRSLTGSWVAGIVAGFLFSFNPYRWSEIHHAQLLPFFWAPLALLCAHRFLETQGRRYYAGLIATLVAQYYVSIYLGTILMILIGVFAGLPLLAERRGKERFAFFTNRRLLGTLVAGGVAGVLALVPLAVPYLQTTRDWDFVRTQAENATFSCEVLSHFVPNRSFASYTWLYPWFDGRIRGYCGLGAMPWLLALGAVWHAWRRRQGNGSDTARVVRRFAWTALAMAILMLGPCLILFNQRWRVPLPYFLVYHLVPGGKALRVPTRFIFPLLLCLAVLGGFAVAQGLRAWRRWRPSLRILAGAALMVVLGLDYAVAENPGVVCEPRAQFPPVYDYLAASGRDRPVLELPAIIGRQFRYLCYQTAHWRPLLGGQSGTVPPALLEMEKRTQGMPTEQTLQFLELTPALTLVIHLDRHAGPERAAWRAADLTRHGFRRAGQFGDALVWERQRPVPASTARLRVACPDLQVTKGRPEVLLVLAPAGRNRPWRYLERGRGELVIEVVDPQGQVQQLTRSFPIPPYLLPGETATIRLEHAAEAFSCARRVRIRGPLIEEFEMDVGSLATATQP